MDGNDPRFSSEAPDDMAGASASPGKVPDVRAALVKQLFGDRTELIRRYASVLAGPAVVRGLIGPREVERLWDRHILNCAVVADLIQPNQRVVDVGSGAGLPGVVLAIRRPDLSVTLIEPLQRRASFLSEAIQELGLVGQVEVLRARAEEVPVRDADVVTSRAVANLEVLAGWSLPLAGPGGKVIAIKGKSAEAELASAQKALRRLGATRWGVELVGTDVLEIPTTVVWVERGISLPARGRRGSKGSRR